MYNKKTIIDALRNLGNPTVPKKTAASEFEMGQEDDNWISAQNGVETPIYKKVKVAPSPIEGKGLFADEPIRKGDVIGVSHIRKEFERGGETYTAPFPSTVLGYYNHSEEPNVKEQDKGGYILMVAQKDIQPGEEITSDYTQHNIGDLETPDNFKKGGAKRPKLPKKKNSSAYSRSLQATNRLFAEHPLFEKPRSRKNKIYDPLSKYYANGGVTYGGPTTPEEWEQEIRTIESQIGNPSGWTLQDYNLLQNKLNDYRSWRENTPEGQAVIDSHNVEGEYNIPLPEHLQDYTNAMMKARLSYANEFGNPAAQRMITLPDNPYQFDNGNTGTHYMASMDNYAVPQIQDENGQLVLGDYGPESNEAMRFDNPDDAQYFAEHYKEVAPGFVEAKLTPEEIEEYVKGGYIVEDISVPKLTKASLGKIVKPVIKPIIQPIKPIVRDIIRSNYNPITYPIKTFAEGIAKQSGAESRSAEQIKEYLFTAAGKKPQYFGSLKEKDFWDPDQIGNFDYGVGKRDLLANYFRGIETGFEPIDYDFSTDRGLEAIIQEYGPLKAFKLNSEIGHGEPIDIFSLRATNLGNHEYGLPWGSQSLFGDQFIIDPRTGSTRNILNLLPGNLELFRNEYPGLLDEASAITRERLNTLFDQYGQETIPFEMGVKAGYQPEFGLARNPVKPIDDIAGHMIFLRRNADKEFDLTTRDLWGFRPKAYNQKYDLNSFMKRKQSQLVDALGKPFVLTQTNPIRFKKGGFLPKASLGRVVNKQIALAGERIAKQSAVKDRNFSEIVKGTLGLSKPTYFGQETFHVPPAYGEGKRDLIANYFRQNETGFEPIEYDFSADPGLNFAIEKYGPLKAFLLNSAIPHGEPVSAFSLVAKVPGERPLGKYVHPQSKWTYDTGNFLNYNFPIWDPITNQYIKEPLNRLNAFGLKNALEDPKYLDRRLALAEQARKDMNDLFENYGSDTVPFEFVAANGTNPSYSMLTQPVSPIDNIAGHMLFLNRTPEKEFQLTTRDLWSFRPDSYNDKWNMNSAFKRAQVQLMDKYGKPFVLTQTNPITFKEGGTPGEEDCPEGFTYDAELGCIATAPENMTEVQKWITDWYANRKIQFPENDPKYTQNMQKVLPQYNTESLMNKQSNAFPVYKDFPSAVEDTPGGFGAAGQYDTTGDVPVVWFNPNLDDEKKQDVETHELTNHKMREVADVINPINDWLVSKNVIEKDKTWPKEKKEFYDYMLDSDEQNIQSYLNVARRQFGLKPDEVVTKERLDQMRTEAESQGMFDQSSPNFNPDIYLLFHTTKTPEGLLEWFNLIANNDAPKANDETQYAKMGGESDYQLGDTVDKATMEKLKKLGYTFQIQK